MNYCAAIFDQLNLPLNLKGNRTLDKPEGVNVFNLCTGAKGFLTFGAYRHVNVATHGAFRHIAVGNAQISDDGVNRLEIRRGLFGTTHIRLGDDLQ